MNLTNEFKDMFQKVCTNATRSYECEFIDGEYQKVPAKFRRGDLTKWAKEAFDRNENYFYHEPVQPDEPYGRQRLCDPHYEYKLKNNLSTAEYNRFVEALSQLEQANE